MTSDDIEGLLRHIPQELRQRYPDIIDALVFEVQKNFAESGTKSAVSYILKPQTKNRKLDPLAKYFLTVPPPIPTGWRDGYIIARDLLSKNLFTTHPLMIHVLQLWSGYEHIKFVNAADIRGNSFRAPSYRSIMLVNAEKCRDKLINGFYIEVLKLFHSTFVKNLDSKQSFNSSHNTLKEAKRPPSDLFNCAIILVYNKLMTMILNSIQDYLALFEEMKPKEALLDPSSSTVPRFFVRLWLRDGGIDFDPPFVEVKEAIINGLEFVYRTFESLPRIDSIIYHPLAEQILATHQFRLAGIDSADLKIQPEALVVSNAERKIHIFVEKCFLDVKGYLGRYDQYQLLYAPEIEQSVQEFFEKTKLFEDYTVVSCLFSILACVKRY